MDPNSSVQVLPELISELLLLQVYWLLPPAGSPEPVLPPELPVSFENEGKSGELCFALTGWTVYGLATLLILTVTAVVAKILLHVTFK